MRIVPYLVMILVAIAMFRASGALDALIAVIDPFTSPRRLPGGGAADGAAAPALGLGRLRA